MTITIDLRKIMLILGISLMSVSNAAAISNYDLLAITRYTPFYDERACEAGTTADGSNAPSGPLVGSDNQQQAFNYFVAKLSATPGTLSAAERAAAILGNLMQESGIDPASVQPGGAGRGIAQWSAGGRWDHDEGDNLQDFANGRNMIDLHIQLDFMWFEMTKASPWKNSLPALNGASTLGDATFQFMQKFEGAGDPRMTNRINYAKEILAKYGNGAVPTTGGTPATGNPAAAADCNAAANGAVGAGAAAVSTDGYSFPVATGHKSVNGGVDGLSPLPCTGGVGACHHDKTPAFDIGRQPGEDASAGAVVYAIHAGTIEGVGTYVVSGCFKLHLSSEETDGHWDYFYAHLANVSVKNGQKVAAGAPIAVIGPRACTGNNSEPHLHIDRGCNHQGGGYDSCRDPGIIPIINSLYNALPN
jgi:hypothetical protein